MPPTPPVTGLKVTGVAVAGVSLDSFESGSVTTSTLTLYGARLS